MLFRVISFGFYFCFTWFGSYFFYKMCVVYLFVVWKKQWDWELIIQNKFNLKMG